MKEKTGMIITSKGIIESISPGNEDKVEVGVHEVMADGEAWNLYYIVGTGLEGLAARVADIEAGRVNEQDLFERLGQEYLNYKYGMLPKKDSCLY